MALVQPFSGVSPELGPGVYLAPNATVIGRVVLEAEVSVWFGAVLRGDVGSIRVGRGTNLQDLCCLHMTGGVSDVVIGCDVTVGHSAIIHGATVGDGALIGMGAVLLDDARVGEGSIIAAGSLVPPGADIPARVLARGSPAKVVRELSAREAEQGREGAATYRELMRRYREG